MKKTISLVLLLCVCFSLAACGSAPKASSPAATQAPAAEAAASQSASEDSVDLASLVAQLNTDQESRRKEGDPIRVRYELSGDNTVLYKFTMDVFDVFAMLAEAGDVEAYTAYVDVIHSLPNLYNTVKENLEKIVPDVNVEVRVCTNDKFNSTIAVVKDGIVTYDRVNEIGTAPADDAPPADTSNVEEFLQQIKSENPSANP